MVLLVLTDRIRTAIYQALQSPEFDESAKQRLKNYLKLSSCIPLDLIKEVSKFLVSRDGKLGKEIGNLLFLLCNLLLFMLRKLFHFPEFYRGCLP
jgi:hypothetical protein